MKFIGIVTLALSIPGGSSLDGRLRGRRLESDTFIFNTVSDGSAQGTGDKVGTSCSTDDRRVSFVDDAQDYMDIVTTKWHSGGYRMDCVDKGAHTGWQCAATCSPFPNPNFMNWGYLVFEAKVTGTFDSVCKPTIGLKKRWPSHSSNVLTLEGPYVDGGVLSGADWKTVVLPMSDFATEEWPSVDGVKDIYFRNCGTDYSVNPHYQIRGLLLTDTPPSISPGSITPDPTKAPSDSPTSPAPTTAPSGIPTAPPTEAHWPIWEDGDDSYTLEDASYTCFAQQERLGITYTENEFTNYFTVTPDAWVSGGINFGCQTKDDSHSCNRSCYPFDGTNPDWSSKLFLTFLARIEGESLGCKPSMTLSGGGWPRSSSNRIYLEGSYVDAGSLVPDEFRRVVIPLDDMKTSEWNLNNIFGMYFQTCGFDEEGVHYPYLTYHIASLAVTNHAFDVVSMPPTSSPTPFVPDDPLLATHRFIHTNWYPIFGADREPAGNSWHVVENNAWPNLGTVPPHTVTVHIPQGQTVVYSGTDTTAYDKIIVEGSLVITPVNADVNLIVGTVVVGKGGSLDVTTTESAPFTVTIQVDGALENSIDPEEIMLGVLSLEGSLTVSGNSVPVKMAPLRQTALAGSSVLEINGIDLTAAFQIGGELVLPDTQEGLNVGHWNFPNNDNYLDQTETCTIVSIAESQITCATSFAHDHTAGSNIAYMTRSIQFKTSPTSTDRGHILHTGGGMFEVRNARIENFGRTTTHLIDSTVITPDVNLNFEPDVAKMNVVHQGSNQIARYALHAHHSMVESYFTGNAVLPVGRDGMVAHNSRVHILDNVIVGANGTGIFLEDGTETGPVVGNYVIGTGGGSRGGDDGRFSSQSGMDMAHGGFAIWCRGKLALVAGNHAEGHFGVAPYAFFVHPNFIGDKRVPNVPGTPAELVDNKLRDIKPTHTNGLQLQSYGGFINNTAVATFKVGIDLSYFSSNEDDQVGSIIEGANVRNLALNGRGISTTHSQIFTLNGVTIEGTVADNTMTGIWCNNCNGCTLRTPNTTLVIDNVQTVRGGNC